MNDRGPAQLEPLDDLSSLAIAPDRDDDLRVTDRLSADGTLDHDAENRLAAQ